jgi:hypothetical protein
LDAHFVSGANEDHEPGAPPSPLTFDVAAVRKEIREELDRNNKYLEFAQGQIEKDRSFYKHLYTFSGAFLAFMVAVAGYFSFTSVSQMRSEMKASIDAELAVIRSEAAATSSEAKATVDRELTNVRTEVQRRIDTEFRTDNIAALVATAAKERTDKELGGIINREVTRRMAPRILTELQMNTITESLRSSPNGKVVIRTGNLPEQQNYARNLYNAVAASASWKGQVSYLEPGTLAGMTNDRVLLLEGIVVVVSDSNIAHSPDSVRTLEAALKNAKIADVRIGSCDCDNPPTPPDIWLYVGPQKY